MYNRCTLFYESPKNSVYQASSWGGGGGGQGFTYQPCYLCSASKYFLELMKYILHELL